VALNDKVQRNRRHPAGPPVGFAFLSLKRGNEGLSLQTKEMSCPRRENYRLRHESDISWQRPSDVVAGLFNGAATDPRSPYHSVIPITAAVIMICTKACCGVRPDDGANGTINRNRWGQP
jgi:hypothetical protein